MELREQDRCFERTVWSGTRKTRVTENQLSFFIAISKGMSKKPIL